MKAPQSKRLNRLRAEDPTLNSRIKQAFTAARKNGHERYAFVELQNNKILVVEKLNSSQSSVTTKAGSNKNKKNKKGSAFKATLSKVVNLLPL